MKYLIAIEINEDDNSYGIAVPNLKGCYSAGSTLEEAICNTKEAIKFHLEECKKLGIENEKQESPEYWMTHSEYKGWLWYYIEI